MLALNDVTRQLGTDIHKIISCIITGEKLPAKFHYLSNDLIAPVKDIAENIVKQNKKVNTKFNLHKALTVKFRVKKIYNPINIGNSTQNLNIENNKYYLYVGRIDKEKGVEIFCKILECLNYKGIVVGDGSEKKYLENKYKNIEFVGWKDKNEVQKYIYDSRGFIFPTLWYEGAPLTPLEFMSQGIPCAISDKCAGTEYIKN